MRNILALLSLSFLLAGCFEQPKADKTLENTSKTDTMNTSTQNEVENKSDAVNKIDGMKDSLDASKNMADQAIEDTKEVLKDSLDNAKESVKVLAETSEEKLKSTVENAKTMLEVDKASDKVNVTTETSSVLSEQSGNSVIPSSVNNVSDKNIELTVPSKAVNVSSKSSKETGGRVSELLPVDSKVSKASKASVVKSNYSTMTPSSDLAPRKVVKRTIEQSEEEYIDGLSPEEHRVGYQSIMSFSHIAFLKTQCRYPFMSDLEVKNYRCEVKEVIIE